MSAETPEVQFKNEVVALVRRWEGPGGESDIELEELAYLATEALEELIEEPGDTVSFDADDDLLDEINGEHEERGDDT